MASSSLTGCAYSVPRWRRETEAKRRVSQSVSVPVPMPARGGRARFGLGKMRESGRLPPSPLPPASPPPRFPKSYFSFFDFERKKKTRAREVLEGTCAQFRASCTSRIRWRIFLDLPVVLIELCSAPCSQVLLRVLSFPVSRSRLVWVDHDVLLRSYASGQRKLLRARRRASP